MAYIYTPHRLCNRQFLEKERRKSVELMHTIILCVNPCVACLSMRMMSLLQVLIDECLLELWELDVICRKSSSA